ncbi:MAG: hypothetical protein ACRCZE_03645 [Candidatus Altimarinota bacterium]
MFGKKITINSLTKISKIFLATFLGIFSLINFASAQSTAPRDFTFDVNTLSTKGQEQSYLDAAANGGNPLAAFIIQIINFIVLISGSVSFLLIVIGGFMILSSAGNETNLNKGKDIIKIAIIGLVLTLSSYFIVAFVQGILFGV